MGWIVSHDVSLRDTTSRIWAIVIMSQCSQFLAIFELLLSDLCKKKYQLYLLIPDTNTMKYSTFKGPSFDRDDDEIYV